MSQVLGLYRYPVKSCGGFLVRELPVGERGAVNDRLYMFTQPSGDFMSQRDYPRMCKINARLEGKSIVLSAPDKGDFELPILGTGRQKIEVTMHKRQFGATIFDGRAGEWLADFLGLDFTPHLVFQAPDDLRVVPAGKAGAGAGLAWQDGYPFLMISYASLSDLNKRLPSGSEVAMNRFRANILCSATVPYWEDKVSRMRISGIELVGESLCTRCPVTQTNQSTGVRGKEPMATMLSYRPLRDGFPVFGRNFSHQNTGVLRVGTPIKEL